MTDSRRVGRIAGFLLFVLLPTGLIVPYVMLRPLMGPPAAFLDVAAGMSTVVRLSVLELFVGATLSVGISITLFALLRQRTRALALWVMALALANFTLQLVENSHWLTMLSVSQAYVEAGAAEAEPFQPMGIAVRSAWRWAHYSHIFILVSWLFSLFLLLFRTATVPRVLPALGMSLSMLHFIGITLPVFAGYRMPYPMLFGMPLGIGILATAVWLMVKGLREQDEIASSR